MRLQPPTDSHTTVTSGGRFDCCSVRVHIKATLADIAAGQVRISLHGEHVPAGVSPVPPPPDGLKPMPSALRQLRASCAISKPATVANLAVASLGEGAERNTRIAPPQRVLAGARRRDKRKERGGTIDDATRLDDLVRRHLIPRGMVLLYIPGQQLVLTTAWALEMARLHGRFMIAADAKVDTATGVRSVWTSVRFKTPYGLSAPGCAWIAPDEPALNMERGITALACNLRCDSPSCPHTLIETHTPDGRYERRLCCQRWWQPACMIDKHLPSFNGLQAAGLTKIFLCDFHGYNCFESRLVELGIFGEAADQINWGFRLLKRAASVDQAFTLRNALARFLVRHAAMPDRLWTLADAEAVVDYTDKCWMYPPMILHSWIDADRLALLKRIQHYLLNTTGINEWSHNYWTNILNRALSVRLVSETVVTTCGITADGTLATAGSFFLDAERRCSEAEGRTLPTSTDRMVRHAKACLAYLTLGPNCVYPRTLETMSIHDFVGEAGEADQPAAAAADGREWRRHRRVSGGRMSSALPQQPVRVPDDEELAALVRGAAVAALAESGAAERVLTLADDILPRLQPTFGDLVERRDCMFEALEEWGLNSCAKADGCTLVPRLGGDNIRRHAEAAATRRAARGLSPNFPAGLLPMLKELAHGGPLSDAKAGYVSVENATGRCSCLDSVYHGVMSAELLGGFHDEDGACKHDQLRLLCREAAASEAAAERVRGRCVAYLCEYVSARESHKPKEQRCTPLYTAGKAGDIDALLLALRTHPSIPPTGKGVASTSAEPAEAKAGSGSDSDEGLEADEVAAAEALQTLPRLRCEFAAAALARVGFGFVFVENDDAGGGMGIVVAARSALIPVAHTGEQLQPRDIVLSVGGDSSDPSKLLDSDGQLSVPSGASSVVLEFVRRPQAAGRRYLGGRPKQVKPKYGPNAQRKKKGASGHASRVRDAELLGGAPARVARKPQRARAGARAARDAGTPSADERIEAAFSALAQMGGSSDLEQQRELQSIGEEVEARLLARRELSGAEKAARDAELEGMIYSQ